MNLEALAKAVRDRAMVLRDQDDDFVFNPGDQSELSYLLDALAAMVEGKTIRQAFGAPGDWGYNTPIGSALADIPAAKKAGE